MVLLLGLTARAKPASGCRPKAGPNVQGSGCCRCWRYTVSAPRPVCGQFPSSAKERARGASRARRCGGA